MEKKYNGIKLESNIMCQNILLYLGNQVLMTEDGRIATLSQRVIMSYVG